MGGEEYKVEVFVCDKRVVELPYEMDEVEREPAAGEYDHHGDEHAICVALALELLLLLLFGLAGHGALGQDDPDDRVRIGDDDQRYEILQRIRGYVEETLGHRYRPHFLHIKRLVISRLL